MNKLLNINAITQSILMGISSLTVLITIFFLSQNLNESNFAQFSLFLLILPLIQSFISFNTVSVISVKILKKNDRKRLVNYFFYLICINLCVLLFTLLIVHYYYEISFYIYLYSILISFVITFSDVHNQLLLAKNKSTFSYFFYFIEKILYLLIILLFNSINDLDIYDVLLIYLIVSIITLLIRSIYFNPWNFFYDKKYLNVFCNGFISNKYILFSFLLFLTSYISSNIDRFFSTLYLDGAILSIYTKIFYICSGCNMLAQAIIQSQYTNLFSLINNNLNSIFHLRILEFKFFKIGIFSSFIIFIVLLIYLQIFKDEFLLIYLYIFVIPSTIIMITNKPYGLFIDFAEKPHIKVIASVISIIIPILLYINFFNTGNIYVPAIILFFTTIIYTLLIRYFSRRIIRLK